MINSPPSSCSTQPGESSTAFGRLDHRVQRWIWERGWTDLRDIQEAAISAILDSDRDVIVSAATASGKTEAVFLPLCSKLVGETPKESVRAIYISPLKALINDQFGRLEDLCERLELPVHRWHGDVGGASKHALLRAPSGILLITPESLEALFVLRGHALGAMFAHLDALVIDELHSFIGRERGRQLQSLAHRLEVLLERPVRRIGLSATLGDMSLAAEFLRIGKGRDVEIIVSRADRQEIKLQVRGYETTLPGAAESRDDVGAQAAIAGDLFRVLRQTDNLVFANSRRLVETYADHLRRLCDEARVPNAFHPHHGSLSKEVRESVEELLRNNERAVTVVCTNTLELGIDIGTVTSIAQVGPPPSVASLRQRLGRSGRRGDPAVLRVYVEEEKIGPNTPPQDQLRASLVQSIAMVQLLLEGWCEPPEAEALHLSTLVQQVLSVATQYGGVMADEAWRVLCQGGPFRAVDAAMFGHLLRDLGRQDILMQAGDRSLLPGPVGERIVNHYTFYAAFATPEEYRIVANGRELGTMPLDYAVALGALIIFAGRRWRVEAIDEKQRVIDVVPAKGGSPPRFGGGLGAVHVVVRERMKAVYESAAVPVFLDPGAQDLLQEARANFHRLALERRCVVPWGRDSVLFCWAGDRAQQTLALQLAIGGAGVMVDGLGISVAGMAADAVADRIRDIAEGEVQDAAKLALRAANKIGEKYDHLLGEELLAATYAARQLDPKGAQEIARRIATAEASAGQQSIAVGAPPESAQPTHNVASKEIRPREAAAFAVVDFETTGFSPKRGDRAIEIAIVSLSLDGAVLEEWDTLVNPDRRSGPSWIHGISTDDLLHAPRFNEIAGDVGMRLAGKVIVAHNWRFDLAFLTAEFERARHTVPTLIRLCTLDLTSILEPRASVRRLADCCQRYGVVAQDAHSALGDALATARLLGVYRSLARSRGISKLDEMIGQALAFPKEDWNGLPPASGRRLTRNEATAIRAAHQHYLARIVERLPGDEATSPEEAGYLNLLDRALQDRHISVDESEALLAEAERWSLSASRVHAVHFSYLRALVRAALADGVVSAAERRELEMATRMLGLGEPVLDSLLKPAASQRGEGHG